jgi:hypothetical protein
MADGLETIAHAGSPGEAQLIKDRLAEAGIPAFIVGICWSDGSDGRCNAAHSSARSACRGGYHCGR